MTRSVLISLLGLVSCGIVIGQQPAKAACSLIQVRGPTGIPNFNEPVIFKAFIAEAAKENSLTFKWKAYSGEIVDGQGTPQVRIDWLDRCLNLTVELEFASLTTG